MFKSFNPTQSSRVSRCAQRPSLIIFLLIALLGLAGCGGGGGGDTTTPPPPPPPVVPTPSISLFAGELGGVPGNLDGASGRLSYPRGVAVDNDGNVVVADTGNCSVRQLTGSVLSTIVGSNTGCVSFVADKAIFAPNYDLDTVATDAGGNLYFGMNNKIWKKPRGGSATALSIQPISSAFAVNQSGDIFLNQSNGIYKVSSTGTTALVASNVFARAIAVGADGVLYVAIGSVIQKVSQDGTVSTLAGSLSESGFDDGAGTAARFNNPYGLAVDTIGNVYVADGVRVRKITPAGLTTTLAGSNTIGALVDGPGVNARFGFLWAVAVDKVGNVFVADQGGSAIRRITPDGDVKTVAGSLFTVRAPVDGPATAARFLQPAGLAMDSVGAMYVADSGNYTVRKIGSTGTVSTLAGTPGIYGYKDGVGNTATFTNPAGIAVDTQGNVFVTERFQLLIRKISSVNEVKTIANLVQGGRFDFRQLASIATDRLGNLYAAVIYTPTLGKFPPTGDAIAVACGAGCVPRAVATDSLGNIFVATAGSIRRIAPDGSVVTLAGDPNGSTSSPLILSELVGSRDGIGADARFFVPDALTVDSAGNVFVADTGNHTIRKVTPSGVVTTIAGKAGISGTTPGVLPGLLNSPRGIVIDPMGSLYVSTENAIVKITQ
jgi:sugar lactone lactonase YvrE